MRKILNATSVAQKLCGDQLVKPDTIYRPALHCLRVPCEDGTLLYHTLTGALWLLGADETEEENRNTLIRERFLVPEEFDEQQYVREIRAVLKLATPPKKHKTSFTIFTTTDCNARCYYCYELGISRVTMTPETARDVAAYIARVSGGEEVKLSWFGGEPLFNREAIDIICKELQRLGVPYHSIMTSNGYYLDEETACKAHDLWKVSRVQITVDGTREVYNRVKAYVHCDGDAYERVLRNIECALAAGIKVTIRFNVDASNIDDVFTLADELYARFGVREDLDYAPTLLREWAGPIHAFSSEADMTERYQVLINKMLELGMLKDSALYREIPINHCIADNDGCETILPDGQVGKCDQFQGKDLVGSIYDEHRNEALLREWKEQIELPECEQCPMFPRCLHLKKCNWVKNGCEHSFRTRLVLGTKRKMLAEYQKVRSTQG